MRRFELIEGASSKFWEVLVQDAELTVTFGRIGTKGQTKTKTFASHDATLAEEAKLIREKTGKGYREVQAPGGAVTPAPAPAADPPEAFAEPEAEVLPEPPPAPSCAAPNPPEILWPTGGFQWNNQLRGQLPIVRGIHVPKFKPPTDPLTHVPEFPDSVPLNHLEAFFKQHGLVDVAPWSAAEAAEKIQPARLREPDLDYWRCLFLQCAAQAFYQCRQKIHWDLILWATEAAIALHSPVFATRLFLELSDPLACGSEHFRYLRWALAAAPEDQYLAARRVATEFRGQSALRSGLSCFLFPDQQAWADECVFSGDRRGTSWVHHSVMSVEAFQSLYKDRRADYFGPRREVLLLHIYLNDAAAWPYLERLDENALGLAARMWIPELIPTLVKSCAWSKAGNALEKLAEHWPAAVIKSVMDRAITGRSGEVIALAGRIATQHPEALATVLAVATEAERQAYLEAFAFLAPAPEEAPADLLPTALRQLLPDVDHAAEFPAFYLPGNFHRPRLLNGLALPPSALDNLARLLAASSLPEPRPELAEIKAACAPESLAEFAWDVFQAWQSAGNSNKAIWGFNALGLLGDDTTAQRLVTEIRDWRKYNNHIRANQGLDMLAVIGSDEALRYLNGIAHNPKLKALRDRAVEKITKVAETRGLTAEELADRLVPDLGLDEHGGMVLDFGPRQFRVGFDEALAPFVTDAAGVRLGDLPRPNKSDDAAKASAAVVRFKELKKDAKAIAALQISRLEQAMCARRRWSWEDFRRFLLTHPLLRHLARRLVWGVFQNGQLTDAFRVAEDFSLADRRDELYEFPAGAGTGVVHALELPGDLLRDFGQIFGDYEIRQPFKQLGRETFALTEAERQAGNITRFTGREVSTGAIMGLIGRGWEWGREDAFHYVDTLRKRLPGGVQAELWIKPGVNPRAPQDDREQEIRALGVHRLEWRLPDTGRVPVTELDPVLASEIIRDVDLMGAIKP